MGFESQRGDGFGERCNILFTVVPAGYKARSAVAPIVKVEALRPKRCGLRRSQANAYFIGLNRMKQPLGRGRSNDLCRGICGPGVVEPQIGVQKRKQLRRQKPPL